MNNASAIQNSLVSLNGSGALAFGTGLGTFTVAGLSGNGNFTLADTGSNPVALQIGNNNTGSTFAGALSGAGSVTKIGTAQVILSGANTFTGGLTVSTGSVSLQNGSALGTSGAGATVASGANLDIGNNIILANVPITITGSGITNGGAISNSSGTGARIGPNNVGFASGSSGPSRIIPGTTIKLGGDATINNSSGGYLSINANVIPVSSAAGTTTLTLRGSKDTGTGGGQGSNLTDSGLNTSNAINGTISDNGSNSVAVVKTDAGSWIISDPTNRYTGGTTINAGTLNAVNGFNTALSGNITPLGTGPINLNGGNLNLYSSIDASIKWGPGIGYTINVQNSPSMFIQRAQSFTGQGTSNSTNYIGNLNMGGASPATLSFNNSNDGFVVKVSGATTLLNNATFNMLGTLGSQGFAALSLSGNLTDGAGSYSLTKTGATPFGYDYTGNATFDGGTSITAGAIAWLPGAPRATPAASPFQFGTGTITLNGAGAAFGLQDSTAVANPTTSTIPNYYINNPFSIGASGGIVNVGGTKNSSSVTNNAYIAQYRRAPQNSHHTHYCRNRLNGIDLCNITLAFRPTFR